MADNKKQDKNNGVGNKSFKKQSYDYKKESFFSSGNNKPSSSSNSVPGIKTKNYIKKLTDRKKDDSGLQFWQEEIAAEKNEINPQSLRVKGKKYKFIDNGQRKRFHNQKAGITGQGKIISGVQENTGKKFSFIKKNESSRKSYKVSKQNSFRETKSITSGFQVKKNNYIIKLTDSKKYINEYEIINSNTISTATGEAHKKYIKKFAFIKKKNSNFIKSNGSNRYINEDNINESININAITEETQKIKEKSIPDNNKKAIYFNTVNGRKSFKFINKETKNIRKSFKVIKKPSKFINKDITNITPTDITIANDIDNIKKFSFKVYTGDKKIGNFTPFNPTKKDLANTGVEAPKYIKMQKNVSGGSQAVKKILEGKLNQTRQFKKLMFLKKNFIAKKISAESMEASRKAVLVSAKETIKAAMYAMLKAVGSIIGGGSSVLLSIIVFFTTAITQITAVPFGLRVNDDNIYYSDAEDIGTYEGIQGYYGILDGVIEEANAEILSYLPGGSEQQSMMNCITSGIDPNEQMDYEYAMQEYEYYGSWINWSTGELIFEEPIPPEPQDWADGIPAHDQDGEFVEGSANCTPTYGGAEWCDDTDAQQIPNGLLYNEFLSILSTYYIKLSTNPVPGNPLQEWHLLGEDDVKSQYNSVPFWIFKAELKNYPCEGCCIHQWTETHQGTGTGTDIEGNEYTYTYYYDVDCEYIHCPGHYMHELNLKLFFERKQVEIPLFNEIPLYQSDGVTPLYKLDIDGNILTDDYGNPIVITQSVPVFTGDTDADGNPIQATELKDVGGIEGFLELWEFDESDIDIYEQILNEVLIILNTT